MARSALHGSSRVMCTLLLLFCTRLSACREIPELAASEMIATSFVWNRERETGRESFIFLSPTSPHFIRKSYRKWPKALWGPGASWIFTFSPSIKRSFSLMFTWSMVNPCSARDSYCTLPSGLRTTRPLRPVIYTYTRLQRKYAFAHTSENDSFVLRPCKPSPRTLSLGLRIDRSARPVC